jgi:hypothetical protein
MRKMVEYSRTMSSKTLDMLIGLYVSKGMGVAEAKEVVNKLLIENTQATLRIPLSDGSKIRLVFSGQLPNGTRKYAVIHDITNEYGMPFEHLFCTSYGTYSVANTHRDQPRSLGSMKDYKYSPPASSASSASALSSAPSRSSVSVPPSSASSASAPSSASSASSSGLDIRTLVPGKRYDVTNKAGIKQFLTFINIKDNQVCFAHHTYCIPASEITQITTPVHPVAGLPGSTSGGRKRRSTRHKRRHAKRRHTRR